MDKGRHDNELIEALFVRRIYRVVSSTYCISRIFKRLVVLRAAEFSKSLN